MPYTSLGISGDPCSGKSTLVKRLAAELRWEVVSIGGLFRTRFEEWKSKTPITTTSENDFDYWWAHRVTDLDIRSVNTEAENRLARGNVILDSRYVAENARHSPSTARIYLTAPLEVRAQRASGAGRYEGLPIGGSGGVMDLLNQRSQNEFRRGEELFKVDYRDTRNYHLVLNTGLLTLDEEVYLSLELLGRKS